jgi:hypothetical protein
VQWQWQAERVHKQANFRQLNGVQKWFAVTVAGTGRACTTASFTGSFVFTNRSLSFFMLVLHGALQNSCAMVWMFIFWMSSCIMYCFRTYCSSLAASRDLEVRNMGHAPHVGVNAVYIFISSQVYVLAVKYKHGRNYRSN